MAFMTPDPSYSDPERAAIVSQAHSGAALDVLRCPRDGAVLKVFFATFQPRSNGATPRGVAHPDWGDVTGISVLCPQCGALSARMDISR